MRPARPSCEPLRSLLCARGFSRKPLRSPARAFTFSYKPLGAGVGPACPRLKPLRTAGRFAIAYTTLLDRLLGSTAHEIDYRNNAVMIVIGEAAHYMGVLAPALWRASTIGGYPAADAARAGAPGDAPPNYP